MSCHVIMKSHHARQSYELDITGFYGSIWTKFKYDRELWASNMSFVCNTPSCHYNNLCHIIYKSQHRRPSYGQTRTGFTQIYAQSLNADYDIDLWPNNMVLVRDTLFCHDDHLYQLIFKSHLAWPSYGSDITSFTEACARCLRVDCDLDL